MVYINTVTNQFYFGREVPPGNDWRLVTIEEYNILISEGWQPETYIPPHRVSKDTITTRVLDAGKLPDLMALISSLPSEQQFLWTNYAWFWNNNTTVIGMCQQLGLETSVILAPDPYL